jgi:hypothetical protein
VKLSAYLAQRKTIVGASLSVTAGLVIAAVLAMSISNSSSAQQDKRSKVQNQGENPAAPKSVQPLVKPSNASAKISQAQKSKPSEAKPVTEEKQVKNEAIKKQLAQIAPLFSQARGKREKSYGEHVNRMRTLIKTIYSDLDTSQFVEEMLGLEATFRTMGSESDLEDYVARCFSRYVVDPEAVTKSVQAIYDSYNAECARIDNEFLVACRLDLTIDPAQLKRMRLDAGPVRSALIEARSSLKSSLYDAVEQSFVATGVGLVAGGVGAQLGHELGKDADGNPTIMSGILGLAFGIAAEQMAEEVTLDVMETRENLDAATRDVASNIFLSVVGNGPELSVSEKAMQQIWIDHEIMLIKAIAEHLDVHPKIVVDHIN